MDPTALPTDNLYKFLALSGLAIVGFSIWFGWTRWPAFQERAFKILQELAEVGGLIQGSKLKLEFHSAYGTTLQPERAVALALLSKPLAPVATLPLAKP